MTIAEFREHCLAYRLKALHNTSTATAEFLKICEIFYNENDKNNKLRI
jgi:hypothetical protein